MFIFEIKVTGLDHAQQVLAQIQSPGAHRNLMVLVAGLVERQTKKRLAEEKRAPDGSVWAPWSASYARRRPRGAGLMVDTGRLLGSISSSVNSNSALVGTNVFYGAFHQTGTRKMPARPFMGLSGENISELDRVIDGWLRTLLA